ncbi:DUF3866 family protein [Numidum massiliense]|uniref:DUF3866 family protein n=1 Tax=Numidum massiliense TaxID=1522315 RepID=UPI0006D5A811|nr:DUF3866 family protein [Numidum massiliense]
MIHWAEGTVVEELERRPGLQYVAVRKREEGRSARVVPAIHFTDWQPPLGIGDRVVLNTTATDLRLGSGGYDFVAWREGEPIDRQPFPGHIVKLRYTPWQLAVRTVEEQGSPAHEQLQGASHIAGMPVLVGELHSMLPILATSLRHLTRAAGYDLRLAYVMTDGAALPIKLSRHVQWLRENDWLVGTVTVGHAFGGDLEAVNVYSGLLAAKHVLQADITIVLMGPGIVGTGTMYGFSGVEQGQIVNAVHTLGGMPIVVPRMSFADRRARHHGLSHHTKTNIAHTILQPAYIALPHIQQDEWRAHCEAQVKAIQREMEKRNKPSHHWRRIRLSDAALKQRLSLYPQRLTTMGRGWEEDPIFFYGVACAADVAWSLFRDSGGSVPGTGASGENGR